MKKATYIMLFTLIVSVTAKAQKTPVTVSQPEATAVISSLTKGLQLIHKLDIPALKRDSLDMYIATVAQFIDEKNKAAAKIDTGKNTVPLAKKKP